jgi:hypothetical protein
MKLVLKKALYPSLLSLSVLIGSVHVNAQNNSNEETEDDILLLSPFTVESSSEVGYLATETLSGTRLRTSMKDIGSSITVATEEFMNDLNATDNETLMEYMAGTEVGGERSINLPTYGGGSTVTDNFGSASSSTRIRGLATADNTLDFFLSSVNWDGYAVDRVDVQRGPNAILFGLGSPAGIINGSLRSARFGENKGHLDFQYKSYDSRRMSGRYNMEILKDELAVLGAFVNEKRNYRQKPAYDNQDRYYGAVKYAPRWLQTGSSTFTIDVKGESGHTNSNRPRWTPPIDKITQFWDSKEDGGLGGETLDPKAAWDTTGYYGNGEAQEKVYNWDYENNGVDWDSQHDNANYIASLTSMAPGPAVVYSDPNSSTQNDYIYQPQMGNGQYWALDEDGERDGYLSYPTTTFMTFKSYNDYAEDAGLPLSETGSYKERSLTDATIFDFYNNLIDGPNKHEFSEFDTITGTIRHTFLNNQIGYELSAFKQEEKSGSSSTLGWTSELSIDFNETLTDGSPNPNVGRPYVANSYRYQESRSSNERESYRASAFAEYDFRNLDRGSMSWLWKALGKHVFNGAVSQERHFSESYGFSRYAFPDSFAEYQLSEAYDNGLPLDASDWMLNVQAIHYLGDSLLDQSSASGANISSLGAVQRPVSGTFYTFDDTWIATDVDPGDSWISDKGEESTQSENPDNYVGWTTMELPISDTVEDDTYKSRLNSATKTIDKVVSKTLVWQGRFFDEALVAMYGWREDSDKSASVEAPNRVDSEGNSIGFKNYYDEAYVLPSLSDVEEVTGQSNSYSLALHLNDLKYMGWLPLNVSLFYNESENFQPVTGRTDIYNRDIPMPQGHTKDASILLSTKDNRLSLRVGKYDCSVENVTADILPGTWIASQFYAEGTKSAIRYYYDLSSGGYTLDYQLTEAEKAEAIENSNGNQWAYASWNMVDKTDEEETEIVNAWWDFVRATNPGVFQAFELEEVLSALPENGSPQNVVWGGTSTLKFTQDVVSKGYEIELSALPIDNWRIRVSASQTKAIRSNVGGEACADWVALVDEYMAGPAGDMYLWGTNLIRNQWQNFRLQYALAQLLDGQAQPDIREWSFNIVNNYDFREGWLKGTNIGCAYRWRDKSAIGYPYIEDAEGNITLDAENPYYGPTEDFWDAWIGYSWTMWDKYWNVKFNVQNIFASDDLIPINTQPDGTIASYRIPPSRTFQLSLNVDF